MALESTISAAASARHRYVFTPADLGGDLALTIRPYTIAGFFQSANASLQYIFGMEGLTRTSHTSTGSEISFIGYNLNATQASFQFQDGFGSAIAAPGTTQALNTTYHVTGVSVNNTLRHIYIDGICAGTNTASQVLGTPGAITVLGMTATTSRACRASECAIWNAELTNDEIASLAKGVKPSSVRPESLIFYAPLVRDIYDIVGGRTYVPSPIAATGARIAVHPRRYG